MAKNQKSKSSNDSSNINRRDMLLGTMAVASQPLLGGVAMASVPSSPTINVPPSPIVGSITRAFGGVDNTSVLVAQTIDYLDRSLRYKELNQGNWKHFVARWEEGRKLHDALRANAQALNITSTHTLILDGEKFEFPMGVKSLPTAEQFFADEMEIFYRTNRAHLTAINNRTSPREAGIVAVTKLLSLFGLKDISAAIFEILEADGLLNPDLWTRKNLPKTLERLLKHLISTDFIKKLGQKAGKQIAKKVVGEIAGRLVPFVGWVLLVSSLIWAIYEQVSKQRTVDSPISVM